MGPHTTTDDHLRYRREEDVEAWRTRDPVDRMRAFLEREAAWSADRQEELEAHAAAEVERAVAEAEELEPLEPGEIFTAMFAEPTAPLQEQAGMAAPGGDA